MRVPQRLPTAGIDLPFVGRREPQMGATYFGTNVQMENVPVQESPQGAPDPIRQSQYYAQGRAPSERWPGVNLALHMNIAGIQAVAQDTFLTGKVRPLRMVLMSNQLGGQAAWTDRQNIDRGQSNPYGNRVAIKPAGQVPIGAVDGYGITYQPRGFRR